MIRTIAPQRVNAVDFLISVKDNGRGIYTPKQTEKLFDYIASDIVRASNDWQCCKCGHPYTPPTTELHHAHIIARKHHTTRWLFKNGIALCGKDHKWLDEIKHIRTKLILRDDYSLPQMQFLLDIGYSKQSLVELAIRSQEIWKGDYSLVAFHLLEKVNCL